MNNEQLIDTHCHLYLEEFQSDISAVMQRAREAGVSRVYLPNIDTTSIEPMRQLTLQYPDFCFPMMGLHPCYADENTSAALAIMEKELASGRYCAIGEVGLDYHWDVSDKAVQYAAFEQQIQWAADARLPLIIHSRQSTTDCIELIKKHQQGNLKGIFHCFGGTLEEAKKIEDLGFLVGIGGVITYKNAGLKEIVKDIPITQIVLETDAPYLSPVPFRGKRNEPAYLTYILSILAEARQESPEGLAAQTTENALKLFGHSV
jgi:TatD DNase family protein